MLPEWCLALVGGRVHPTRRGHRQAPKRAQARLAKPGRTRETSRKARAPRPANPLPKTSPLAGRLRSGPPFRPLAKPACTGTSSTRCLKTAGSSSSAPTSRRRVAAWSTKCYSHSSWDVWLYIIRYPCIAYTAATTQRGWCK